MNGSPSPRVHASLTFRAAALLAMVAGCASAAPLPPRALELNRDGATALASGDLEVAEARLRLALEYNPRFTEAWVNLGLVELERGNFESAERHLGRARSLNPDLPAPHHALGLLADRRRRFADAETHYRAALAVDPGFVPARINLGRRLFARAADDEAQSQFLRAVEIDPSNEEAWAGLVESRLRLGREDDADRSLDAALSRAADAPSLRLLLGRRHLRRGDPAAAAAVLEPLAADAVSERSADDAIRAAAARAWLAVARLGRGDVDGAVTAAEGALRLDRESDVAAFALGAALLERGEKARARALLERVLARAPRNEAARALLERAR